MKPLNLFGIFQSTAPVIDNNNPSIKYAKPKQWVRFVKSPGACPKPGSKKFVYKGDVGNHLWYNGTPRPWEFKRVWRLEPSLNDPDTVYAGVENAALFRTTDGGLTWQELSGLRSAKGHLWQPGACGMSVHTILLDPSNPNRIFVAISAAGVFRTDDAGETWRPINRGLKSAYELADPNSERRDSPTRMPEIRGDQ